MGVSQNGGAPNPIFWSILLNPWTWGSPILRNPMSQHCPAGHLCGVLSAWPNNPPSSRKSQRGCLAQQAQWSLKCTSKIFKSSSQNEFSWVKPKIPKIIPNIIPKIKWQLEGTARNSQRMAHVYCPSNVRYRGEHVFSNQRCNFHMNNDDKPINLVRKSTFSEVIPINFANGIYKTWCNYVFSTQAMGKRHLCMD